MPPRVAINGFGRVGRNILRAVLESDRSDIEVVAINDLGPVDTNAHLLRHGSVHGRFACKIVVDGEAIRIAGHAPTRVTAIRNPAEPPHAELGADVALECTFTTPATDAMRDLCRERFDALATAGNASRIKVIPMDEMARRYARGLLSRQIAAARAA